MGSTKTMDRHLWCGLVVCKGDSGSGAYQCWNEVLCGIVEKESIMAKSRYVEVSMKKCAGWVHTSS